MPIPEDADRWSALRMPPDKVEQCVTRARNAPEIWEMVKDRELEIVKALADAAAQGLSGDDRRAVLDPPKFPTLERIASDLVKAEFGTEHRFDIGSLIVALRRAARIELGLAV